MKRENDAFSRAQSKPSGFTGCADYRKERFRCGRKAPYHAARVERIASATTSVSVRPLAASSGPQVRTDAARARDVQVRQETKSVQSGKRVSVGGDLGVRRTIKK